MTIDTILLAIGLAVGLHWRITTTGWFRNWADKRRRDRRDK